MKTEADLGHWLAKLGAGRAACVFSPDVSDTLCVLGQAATSVRQPLRVVSMTWQAVPPLANELGLLVSALARATLDFFPALYGFEQDSEPSRWSKSVVEQEAHAITRGVPDVDGTACRRILSACHRGDVPSLGKLQRAEQARQFALAIEPNRLLVMVAVLDAPASDEALRSLAQGTEWLAGNTKSPVVLVLPSQLAGHTDLDHVTYGACLHADEAFGMPAVDRATRTSALPSNATRAPVTSLVTASVPEEPVITVSPIVGKPAKHSEAEQTLHARLTSDAKLRSLFAYNQCVETRAGTTPRVDLVWEGGKLVIEVDGDDHRRHQQFTTDRHRDYELFISGYAVIRFTHSRVIEQTDWVVERIREAVRFVSEREKL
jgi:very-short-patch-repair endonuclease